MKGPPLFETAMHRPGTPTAPAEWVSADTHFRYLQVPGPIYGRVRLLLVCLRDWKRGVIRGSEFAYVNQRFPTRTLVECSNPSTSR
jgi:hypothetical protein